MLKYIWKYFGDQNQSFLGNDLLKSNQVQNDEMVNQIIYSINELRSTVIREEMPENENPKKIINIV